MSKELRNSNPHDLKKVDEAPNNYISGDELLILLRKHGVKIDDTNIPRFCSNNLIKMIKVTRVSSFGSTPTWYQQPSKSKLENIIANLKNNNNSFLGREILKNKRKEILKIFDNAKNKSVSKTSIAESVSKILGITCNRKFVRKVLDERPQSQLKKKLKKIS
tara:strand:+ start:249 stop:734 length:486 start_codon:yes stop_codon:yes gene_type:complete